MFCSRSLSVCSITPFLPGTVVLIRLPVRSYRLHKIKLSGLFWIKISCIISVRMILKRLNFLDIQNRAKQLRLNHVFNIFNEIGPEYLRSNFTRVLNSHNHNTRNSVQNFVIPKQSTVISGSFYYNAIMDWSSLPSAIKSISNISAFKKSVRTHLMNEISCWCTFFNHLYLFLSCMLLSNVSLFSLFLMLVLNDLSGNKL